MPTKIYVSMCRLHFVNNKTDFIFQVQQANTAVGGMLLANMERTGANYRLMKIGKFHPNFIFFYSRISIHRLLCDKYDPNRSNKFLQWDA